VKDFKAVNAQRQNMLDAVFAVVFALILERAGVRVTDFLSTRITDYESIFAEFGTAVIAIGQARGFQNLSIYVSIALATEDSCSFWKGNFFQEIVFIIFHMIHL
jgi:hypothetical protein